MFSTGPISHSRIRYPSSSDFSPMMRPAPPHALTKRLVNHAPPNDVTEGYAADWTIGQLRDPAQRIADRIEALMLNEHAPATETS